jgi:hypothetical protein
MATADDAAAARPPQLTLYSRVHCHLCDEMIAGLHRMQPQHAFTLNVVDVDRDRRLAARFGADVPVLVHGARELCRHRLDAAGVGAYLSGVRPDR